VSSQWIEKPVATRKPEAMEWVEYSVEWQLRLRAEGSMHVAVLLVTDGVDAVRPYARRSRIR